MPASGGEPTPVTALDSSHKEDAHYYPQFLPDGKHFLYFRRSVDWERSGMYLGVLDDSESGRKDKEILKTGMRAIYVQAPGGGPGYLVQTRGTDLVAQPFDPRNGSISGETTVIAQNVFQLAANSFTDVSASSGGVLSYTLADSGQILTTRDRFGNRTGEPVALGSQIGSFRVSPDGRKAISARADSLQGGSLWMTDLVRNTSIRLMADTNSLTPAWSPDGEKVAYSLNRKLFVIPADGSGKAEAVLEEDGAIALSDWTRDGRYFVYSKQSGETKWDIWAAPSNGRGKPFPLVHGLSRQLGGRVSPDGRWLAYVSNETGINEVYLQAFPEPRRKLLLSSGGGIFPRWRQDSRELVYRGVGQLKTVSLQATGDFITASKAVDLFPVPALSDMAADGKRFFTLDSGGAGRRSIVVLMNWQPRL